MKKKVLSALLVTAMLATGKIRNYQIVVGGLQSLNLPISYVLLRMGFVPETIFITAIVISVCCEMARLYMLRNMINLPVRDFLKKVYFNVIGVFVVASIVPYVLKSQLNDNFLNFILVCSVCLFCTLLSILFIGCNRKERMFVYERAALLRRKLIHK